jgi:hypothetical protein
MATFCFLVCFMGVPVVVLATCCAYIEENHYRIAWLYSFWHSSLAGLVIVSLYAVVCTVQTSAAVKAASFVMQGECSCRH